MPPLLLDPGGQERDQPARPPALAMPELSKNVRREGPPPRGPGAEGIGAAALPRRRGPAGHRAAGGRQPQLGDELGETGGRRPGLGRGPGVAGRLGGGGRAMDLCVEKKEACWLWWAVDRATKRILGWALGDRSAHTARRLDAQLPHGAHITFATDFRHAYGQVFAGRRHVQGKAHTFTIESCNNRLRVCLARLRASVRKGRPFGAETWVTRMARRLGLESTLRGPGRPRKILENQ